MATEVLARRVQDAITSRVKLEMRRLDRELRAVLRGEILKVIQGDSDGITPASIIGSIGLSDRQAETVERARQRLLKEGKLKGAALKKDLDQLRVRLLRERAELIAEHETRLARSLGQAAAWERMLQDGRLPGGKRAWEKLWVASDDERTCGICMELDGTTAKLDAGFGDDGEFFMPPDPHPRCRCSVVLVKRERNSLEEAVEVLAEIHARVDPRIPDAWNPDVPGGDPRAWKIRGKIRRKGGLGPLKPGMVNPTKTHVKFPGEDIGKHPGRIDRPRFRVDENEEGHWVKIEGHPVFISGPPPPGWYQPKGRKNKVPGAPQASPNSSVIGAGPDDTSVMLADEQLLSTSAITAQKEDQGGINGAYRLTFADGTKAKFKPLAEEHAEAGRQFLVENTMIREVVAPKIGREVGMADMFPAVVERDIPGLGPGALQRYVENAKPGRAVVDRFDGDRLKDVAVFDYVMGAGDRHAGNWLVENKTGNLVLIDHGYMLPRDGDWAGHNPQVMDQARRAYRGDDITAHAKRWMDKKDVLVDIMRAHKIPKEAIAGFLTRLVELQNMKTFGDMKPARHRFK